MARGNQPDNLPKGEDIHRLRCSVNGKGRLTSWEEIGNRFGVSRQAAHKKWNQWRKKQAKAGVTIENPRPPKKDDVTSSPAEITTGVDESSQVTDNDPSQILVDKG